MITLNVLLFVVWALIYRYGPTVEYGLCCGELTSWWQATCFISGMLGIVLTCANIMLHFGEQVLYFMNHF